jgi:outer membrane lipoprotein-sorting protein
MRYYRYFLKCLFIAICNFTLLNVNAQKQADVATIVDRMFAKNKTIHTLQCQVNISERIDNKMVVSDPLFKIQISPRKIYLKQKAIGVDAYGVYIEGQNQNNVHLVLHSFPKLKLNLDPYGNKLRDGHHHTVFDAGFGYFINVAEHIKQKNGSAFSKNLVMKGEDVVSGRKCWTIEYNNPDFRFTLYTVQKGENLISIAKKLFVNDYMILQLNPSCKDYYNVKEGKKLIVPTEYAKRFVLYIDKEIYLPLRIDVFDNKGLYGRYIYSNVIINPTLSNDDFSYKALE